MREELPRFHWLGDIFAQSYAIVVFTAFFRLNERGYAQLHFYWDLEIVGDLHRGANDQDFLAIFVLNLADYIETTCFIKEHGLA